MHSEHLLTFTHTFSHSPSDVQAFTSSEKTTVSEDQEVTTRRPVRILLAEDHDDTRDALKLLLELDGYEVIVARDGEEALTAAQERSPDIVITDFDMPKLDGAGLAQALRSETNVLANVPIVVLTAHGWNVIQSAIDAGANIHIAKPVDFAQLNSALGTLVEKIRSGIAAEPRVVTGALEESEA